MRDRIGSEFWIGSESCTGGERTLKGGLCRLEEDAWDLFWCEGATGMCSGRCSNIVVGDVPSVLISDLVPLSPRSHRRTRGGREAGVSERALEVARWMSNPSKIGCVVPHAKRSS